MKKSYQAQSRKLAARRRKKRKYNYTSNDFPKPRHIEADLLWHKILGIRK